MEEIQYNHTQLFTVHCKHVKKCAQYKELQRVKEKKNKPYKSENIRRDPYWRGKGQEEKESGTRMAFSRRRYNSA